MGSHGSGEAASWCDAFYLSLGRRVRETIADGDCALDALCIVSGADRTLPSRNALRVELSNVLLGRLGDPQMEETFKLCGEMEARRSGAHAPAVAGGPPPAGAAGGAGAGNDETSKALAWVCGLKNASSAMVSRVRVGLPEWCLEGGSAAIQSSSAGKRKRIHGCGDHEGQAAPRTPTVWQLTRDDAQQGRISFWGVFAACWCGSRQGVAARALSALPRRRTWSQAQQW